MSQVKPKQEFVATSTETGYDSKYISESDENEEYSLDHILSLVRPRDKNIHALGQASSSLTLPYALNLEFSC